MKTDPVDTVTKEDESTDADIAAEVAAGTGMTTEIADRGIGADQETGAAGRTRDLTGREVRIEAGLVEDTIGIVETEAEIGEGLVQGSIVGARRAPKEDETTSLEDTLGIAPNL